MPLTSIRWKRAALVGCVVFMIQVGFLLLATYVLHSYGATLRGLVENQDAIEFIDLAVSLHETGSFTFPPDYYPDGVQRPETFRTPGYPLLVAGIFGIFGNPGTSDDSRASFYILLIFLCAVSSAAAGALYGVARMLEMPEGASSAAGILFGASPAVIFLPTSGMGSDTVFVFLFILSLFFLLKLEEGRFPLYAALIGATMGYATLVRPAALYISIALFLMLPLFTQRSWRPLPRPAILAVLIASLVFGASISPWIIRNYSVAGHASLSSIPAYNFANYNIPRFLAAKEGANEHEEQAKIQASVGNPPDKRYRSFEYTDELTAINSAFLRDNLVPYTVFHAYASVPFFLGSGVNVAYAVIAIETKWQFRAPFFPHIDDNLSKLAYGGSFSGVVRNLLTYWPATFERIVWAALFVLMLASPFAATSVRQRKFFVFGILMTGFIVVLSSPVVQPRYRVPVEPFVWIAAVCSVPALLRTLTSFRRRNPYTPGNG
jgi:hypothetical protein